MRTTVERPGSAAADDRARLRTPAGSPYCRGVGRRLLAPVTRGNFPIRLYQLGTALLVATVIIGFATLPDSRSRDATAAVPPPTTTAAPSSPPPPTTTAAQPVPTSVPVAMSWSSAGGLIVHPDQIDPVLAADEVRADGFGWIAVQIADGETVLPSPSDWLARFRAASGVPVGGWSVLRDHPEAEAQLAATLLAQDHLDFYIADAEQEYGFTSGTEHSLAHKQRSGEFVAAFRAFEPTMSAALTSYCRPDEHDLDWAAWAAAGFAFLPQAYVDQLGADGTPAVCSTAARQWFPRSSIHPVLGVFPGAIPTPTPAEYAVLLGQAGTTGFSLFPFEDGDAATLAAFVTAIRAATIAHPAPS